MFEQYVEWHQELTQRFGNAISLVGGDFNVKFDIENNYKPRCSTCIRGMMEEFNLDDAGSDSKKPTWRRPHLPKSRSRLDYIMYCIVIDVGKSDITLRGAAVNMPRY